jgi:hypothetical protein
MHIRCLPEPIRVVRKRTEHTMSAYTETSVSGTVIADPGPTFPYLTVSDTDRTIKVWKRCRVELFDPFWVSEPIEEELKPRHVMFPSQVPDDLWSVLTEEERLISSLEQARSDIRRLKRTKEILFTVLGVLSLVLLTGVLAYFS